LTEYLTEQEQVELLKNWIKQYSVVIAIGVFLSIIVISGWRYWQQRQYKIISHASLVFDDMVTMRAQRNNADTSIQADKLFTHYSRTAYGQFAALMLARAAVINQNYHEAEKQLLWVVDHGNIASIRQIAALRLARLYISEHKPDASLEVLNDVHDKNFNGLIDEVKGDAYLAMKDPRNARQWYQQALSELPNADVIRPLLQMKYDNLVTNQ
jgi:predicted negative regulator of RcsB-dependent stress response